MILSEVSKTDERDFRTGIRAMQLADHPDFHLHVGIKVCSDEDTSAEQDGHIFGTWLNRC